MDPTTWSDWLKEGYYISYQSTVEPATRKYFFITRREFAHIEYVWEEDVSPNEYSGPYTIDNLENTSAPEKQIWQVIFGINKQVYIYTHVPTDLDRHGLAKVPRQTAALRQVGHYEAWMSPYHQPDWCTEHFLIRPDTPFLAVSCFNPNSRTAVAANQGYGPYRSITFYDDGNPVKLNIFLAKCELEKVGQETNGLLTPADFPKLQADARTGILTSLEGGGAGERIEYVLSSGKKQTIDEISLRKTSRYYDCLENLYRRLIPQRPITLTPMRAPATAT